MTTRRKTTGSLELIALQGFSGDSILAHVPAAIYNRIKAVDPKPLFRAYSIGHETDDIKPRLLSYGKKVVQFFRAAVEQIYEKLSAGTKLFHNHGEGTNSHKGRQDVGEVVGKFKDNIDGSLHTVAVVYIEPDSRDLNLDMASIEAVIEFELIDDNTARAVSVEKITGIALGDSTVERPAFPGAKLLATVQAFAGDSKGRSGMDKKEIIAAINEGGFTPGDLFDNDSLEADTTVAKIVEAETKTAKTAKVAIQDRLGKKLDTKDEQITKLTKDNLRYKTGDSLKEIATTRKLTPAQREFIGDRLDSFKTEAETPEAMQAELQKHVDSELKAFDDHGSKYFGIKSDGNDKSSPGDGAGGDKSTGTTDGGSDTQPSNGTGDMADPKFNDLIPQPIAVS